MSLHRRDDIVAVEIHVGVEGRARNRADDVPGFDENAHARSLSAPLRGSADPGGSPVVHNTGSRSNPLASHQDDLLGAARAAMAVLDRDAEAGERAGSITRDARVAMQEAGAFRMTMPRELGGLEADPVTQYEVIEALSEADGAAGWVAMIGSDAGYFAGRIDPELARELFPSPDLLTCGSSGPSGTAERVDGGVRVKGRWRFASCCKHATWFNAACVMTENGTPVIGSEGRPETRTVVLPIEEVEIVDNWHTTGLCGSSSNDIDVHDVFVPERRVVGHGMSGDPAIKPPSPLYVYWMMIMCNVSGVPMGIARRAIKEACALANEKTQYGTEILFREDAHLQASIGRAETALAAARAFLIETVAELWDTLVAGQDLSMNLKSRFRMANLHGFHVAQDVTRWMYEAGGSGSIYRPHPLERAMRDVTVAGNHLLVRHAAYAEIGRVSLGLDPQSFVLSG
jgi:alkylation response protein AidB-like acyl-CoA dehydrogenase